ncbi:MAG: hypothetical protein ABJA80_01790 [bacterium]
MGADSGTHAVTHVMVQAIPLATRAAPSAGGTSQEQVAVTQLLLMGHASFLRGRLTAALALDGEGLTMPNGELNTGAYGEGFVDRRHPHTYLHEIMVTGRGSAGPIALSATAGRGFAPFGTDDPMVRPLVKFPIDHHLAQILERAVVIGAARAGRLTVEAGAFGGDEPAHPSSLPTAGRFGDSWAVRTTVLPTPMVELQGSYARVASPEDPSGAGLGQRKQSLSARAASADGASYLLAEWARTAAHDPARDADVFAYEAVLFEGALGAGPLGIALRLEQSERPEEDRLQEPFRTPRPSVDLSINGITRWRVVTLHAAAPAVTRRAFAGVPFVEVARLWAMPRDARTLITPERLYGTSRFWMATAGLRLRIGAPLGRMGRYGVADVAGAPLTAMARTLSTPCPLNRPRLRTNPAP